MFNRSQMLKTVWFYFCHIFDIFSGIIVLESEHEKFLCIFHAYFLEQLIR